MAFAFVLLSFALPAGLSVTFMYIPFYAPDHSAVRPMTAPAERSSQFSCEDLFKFFGIHIFSIRVIFKLFFGNIAQ
jgi:hypothetical protein